MASTSGSGASDPGAESLISELEDEVQCPICQERLTRPRVLSCLHSFCERCLRRRPPFIDSDDEDEFGEIPFIKCALCREITDLPAGGISALKLDFRSNKVLEILQTLDTRKRKYAQSEYKCDICKEGKGDVADVPAIDYCQDCGRLFCEQCSKVHRRLPQSSDHHVVVVMELMTGKAKLRKTEHETDAYKTCSGHPGERFRYFCRECRRPVCSICASFGQCRAHRGAVCEFDEAIAEMSGLVQMMIDRLMHRQRKAQGILVNVSDAINKTDDVKRTSIAKQQKRHTELMRLLHTKFQRAVNEREASFGNKIQSLRGISDKAQKMKEMSDKAIGMSGEVLRDSGAANGRDLATAFGCLNSVLDSVLPTQLDTLEREIRTVEQNIAMMPDIKMKGVRLMWSQDEKLTVEPILLESKASGQQTHSAMSSFDPRPAQVRPPVAPIPVREPPMPPLSTARLFCPPPQGTNVQPPVTSVLTARPPVEDRRQSACQCVSTLTMPVTLPNHAIPSTSYSTPAAAGLPIPHSASSANIPLVTPVMRNSLWPPY